MIEPHSAQLGASSWILKATFALPSESVTVEPLPFDDLAGTACPLVARTASWSLPAPRPGVAAGKAEEPAGPAVAGPTEGAVETARLAPGPSRGRTDHDPTAASVRVGA